MAKILVVSGSTRKFGSTQKLIAQLPLLFPDHQWNCSTSYAQLPVFCPDLVEPKELVNWQNELKTSDIVFIITPEYIHNLPAVIKNALEWVTSSGEFMHKKVVACSYTPNEPRGEKALQSLLWSLQALDASILPSLSLYHNSFAWENDKITGGGGIELIEGVLSMS